MDFKTFKNIETSIIEDVEYELPYNLLSEELHQQLQSILDDDSIHHSSKLIHVTQKVRQLIRQGDETGLESDKPKKGSSRAVFFPKENKKIILDGKETWMPTAVKIAFPGSLDRFTGSNMLLGQHQNSVESDHHIIRHHSVLTPIGDNRYETNENGVLMPVLSSHPEHHYIECGRAEKYNSNDLRAHTKNAEFPKGLSHQDIVKSLIHEYHNAHGIDHYSRIKDDVHEKVMEHPHMMNMMDMVNHSSMVPYDIAPRNMGIWEHPHTGKKYPVCIDYGFSKDISKLYSAARKNKSKLL
jgi:hypothetical protein